MRIRLIVAFILGVASAMIPASAAPVEECEVDTNAAPGSIYKGTGSSNEEACER